MPEFESSKNAMCIVTKPPFTLTKIEESLQSGRKELILNKWALQARSQVTLVLTIQMVDAVVRYEPTDRR